jgi:hypothetical protein
MEEKGIEAPYIRVAQVVRESAITIANSGGKNFSANISELYILRRNVRPLTQQAVPTNIREVNLPRCLLL